MISENIARLKASISDICQRIKKDPQEIIIIGVTKYSDRASIDEAVGAGIAHIAENRLQQAIVKYAGLVGVTKHMIGHLQTNKVKSAVELFDVIQSVDSLRLAKEIDTQGIKIGRCVDILVQVNTSGEEQKFGIAPDQVADFLKEMADLKAINVQGLMTIGPLTEDQVRIRDSFKRLRDIFIKTQQEFSSYDKIRMRYLSMGMSDDYAIALEEGSNMIRIGRSIFMRDSG